MIRNDETGNETRLDMKNIITDIEYIILDLTVIERDSSISLVKYNEDNTPKRIPKI